jgi:hypothetical protein
MINQEIVGKRIPSASTFQIKQSDISLFCAAVGESDETVAPPTFAFTVIIKAFEETLKDAGINWDRMVHGDQRFEIRRPIRAGDLLSVSSTIESVRVVAGNELVSVRADIERDGIKIIEAWSTLVVRG